MFKKKKQKIFDKDIALKVLEDLVNLLQSLNITCWLTDGTLLGFYREGGFIGHDTDMDLGVFIKEYRDDLESILISNGWKIVRKLGFKDLGLEFTLSKNNHNIDIFFFYKSEDKVWHAAWQGFKKGKIRYRRMIKYIYDGDLSFKKAKFLGIDVLIPKNTEHYIITKYGTEWKTPVKNWDWALGPKNSKLTDIEVPVVKKKKLF